MTWLFAGPILLLFVSLAVLLPYASFRLAAQNRRRPCGAPSVRRTERERYHLAVFLRDSALVPLLTLVGFFAVALGFHHYLVPDTTLSEIFGEYHPEVSLHAPDLAAWNEAIQRDQAYREWERAQGRTSAPSLPTMVVEHWPLHLVFLLLPLAYLVWFFRGRYLAAARAYHRGVVQRSKRYALRTARAPATPRRRGC